MNDFLSAIAILFVFLVYDYFNTRSIKKKTSKFNASAAGMKVVFKGCKYDCSRDNGRMLKLVGVRDMVYKGYCIPY